jgi:hypothetical protein
LRADAAVGPDDLDVVREQQARHVGGTLAAQGTAFVREAHLCDDRELAGLADGEDRGLQLGQVAQRLEDDQVSPGLQERLDLLAERRASLVGRDRSERGQRLAERPDRSGQEDGLATLLTRLAGDLDRPEVDVADLILEPVLGQLEAVGAEGVGLDQLGAGADVLTVDALDDAGLGEVELVEAALVGDAARVDHRAHAAVGEDGPALQSLDERANHGTDAP